MSSSPIPIRPGRVQQEARQTSQNIVIQIQPSSSVTTDSESYTDETPLSQSIIRPPSPPRCGICQDSISTNIAQLMPCTHTFDFECVSQLLNHPPQHQKQCPLCRTPISEISYTCKETGESRTYIPGSATSPNNPFLRPGERILPNMTPEERNRIVELRRLRRVESFSPPAWELVMPTRWCRDGDSVTFVERVFCLQLEQIHGTHTVSQLHRILAIRTVPYNTATQDTINRLQEASPSAVLDARVEIGHIISSLGLVKDFTELLIDEPPHHLLHDERGLAASSMKRMQIQRSHGEEEITILRTTSLHEIFGLGNSPDDQQDFVNLRGISREARTRAVLNAREEIQGMLEYMLLHFPRMGEEERIERASTGLFERPVVGDMERLCEYCGERERNGDCLLPEARTALLFEMEGGYVLRREP